MITSKQLATRNSFLQSAIRKASQKMCSFKTNRNSVDDISLIRNTGILAHIDAGKTTTTERLLFFSGTISQMGEVHYGNTVTDFMDEERKRGITITSASVTFPWNGYKINLIDTPGHIDFTMEVEQTLCAMDGAVVVLDGSAGVEAQTVTVWKQADRRKLPRIIYINKMDKPNADLNKSVNSVFKQLGAIPLVLHYPIFDKDSVFIGIVNLLNLEKYRWINAKTVPDLTRETLTSKDGSLWDLSLEARFKLVETIADLDDNFAELVISCDANVEKLPSALLNESIRKLSLERKGIPVICGSSYRNIGIQCLLDGIINYLPSPVCNNSGEILKCLGNNLCAKAFKIRHDKYKGPVTFFRIYTGNIRKGLKIYNSRSQKHDFCEKLYIAYANDYEEVAEVGAGNVVAVTGLKNVSTGEIITSSPNVFSLIRKDVPESTNGLNELLFASTFVPDSVFFSSVEAPSLGQQAALDKALLELKKEDPSLRVSINEETGQTVLGGMGELHLEIVKERIRKNYKIDVDLGPLQIAYKEKLVGLARDTFHVQHVLGSSHQSVAIAISAMKSKKDQKSTFLLDRTSENIDKISSIHPKHIAAVEVGVKKALAIGPKLFCPVIDACVILHSLEIGRGTSESIITSTTMQCVKKLIARVGTKLLEPIMNVEIVCSDKQMESVLADLERRRAEICDTDVRGSDLIIRGLVPLAELLGYAKQLRILTSGRASLSLEFHSFKDMSAEEEAKAIKSVTGF